MSALIVDCAVHVECFGQKPCIAGWKGMCNQGSSVFLAAEAFPAFWPLGTVDYLGASSCRCCPCRVLGSG